ncbi:hypothetical protein [Okeania sp. SIO3I5]|uniref:hypothetical protein n=1 Tax=Okeania sp. SIO3I5 TaxID=2607805 RepID=UPI0025E5F5B6|nr:hypothetical protein [Okeania sp. SIO3I5]
MDTDNIVSITADGKLELPSKIQQLNDWFKRIEELGADRNQPSLQEISEMVKEVRREV